MSHAFLAFASVALIGVIAAQDYLVPALRQETISSGLTGPRHGMLLAAYALLAIAMCLATTGAMFVIAVVTSLALAGTAVTNTAWVWVDKLTGKVGGHEIWHLRFTIVVFVGAFALQALGNRGAMWGITAAYVAAPGAVWLLSKRKDYAEKTGVLILAVWLIAWAL